MDTIGIVTTIIASLAGLAVGVCLGAMPLRTDRLDERQRGIQQLLGFIAVGGVLALIIMRQDVASWAIIVAVALGVAIAIIPAVRRALRTRFPLLDERCDRDSCRSGTRRRETSGSHKPKKRRKR